MFFQVRTRTSKNYQNYWDVDRYSQMILPPNRINHSSLKHSILGTQHSLYTSARSTSSGGRLATPRLLSIPIATARMVTIRSASRLGNTKGTKGASNTYRASAQLAAQ